MNAIRIGDRHRAAPLDQSREYYGRNDDILEVSCKLFEIKTAHKDVVEDRHCAAWFPSTNVSGCSSDIHGRLEKTVRLERSDRRIYHEQEGLGAVAGPLHALAHRMDDKPRHGTRHVKRLQDGEPAK